MLIEHMTVILQACHDVFACSLLHRELQNMYVSIPVEIELVVFHMLFPVLQLLQQVRVLLTSACKQISLQAPVN